MKSKILQLNAAYQDNVERLLGEASGYPDAALNTSPRNGGWSAIQTMQHLILSEELSLAYVRKKLSFQPALQPAGLDTRWRAVSLWFYLNLPIKFRAPKIVGDENLPGFASLAETRERWSRIREAWTRFLQEMPDDLAEKAVYRHPLVGRLSWSGTLLFFHYHLDRHHKQIKRALQNGAHS